MLYVFEKDWKKKYCIGCLDKTPSNQYFTCSIKKKKILYKVFEKRFLVKIYVQFSMHISIMHWQPHQSRFLFIFVLQHTFTVSTSISIYVCNSNWASFINSLDYQMDSSISEYNPDVGPKHRIPLIACITANCSIITQTPFSPISQPVADYEIAHSTLYLVIM